MREGMKRRGGFTLIELMITVAIIAILSAIAMPSYLDYVRKGKRADARAQIQAASIAQEKYRLNNATYANTTAAIATACGTATVGCACPSEQGNYCLAAPTVVSGSTYTLTANATSTSQLADTGCTAITYRVNGTTISYGPSPSCWGK